MKFYHIPFLILLLSFNLTKAQNGVGRLLNKDLVDLRGKAGTTIFVNSTPDTLKLSYVFFNWLPYTETREVLKIAPAQKDSIIVTYNFPDFIEVNGKFKVYNSPGNKLICVIRDYKSQKMDINFEGALAQENAYYMAYQQFLGNYNQESQTYYTVSDQLKDWNQFPLKADSITKTRLSFLEQYKGALPDWFKNHEHRRLLYNEYCRLLNALLAKEFHTGQKINVNSKYYDFEKSINKENDMVLNDTYFYCMDNYFADQARLANIKGMSRNVLTIDSLYHQTDIGDINLMFSLGRLYRQDKLMYHTLMSTLKFKETERKIWLDSLIKTKLEKPHTGVAAPPVVLTNISGKHISLSDYAGKMLILNFWAVWCGPCKAEFPYENQIYKHYKDKDLIVINICFDSDKKDWISDTKKHNLQMVNLYSNKGDFNKLMRQFNLTALPASILINRHGKISDNYLKRASLLTNDEIMGLLKL